MALPGLLAGAALVGWVANKLFPPKPIPVNITGWTLREKLAVFDPELIDLDLRQFEEEALDQYPEDYEDSLAWEKVASECIPIPVQCFEVRIYNPVRDEWLVDAPELIPNNPHDLIIWGWVTFAAFEEEWYAGVPFELGGKELLARDWYRMYGLSTIEAEELIMKGVMPWEWK